mmetsp:Transcript_14604/g.41743  ORF Transcript_14604/g.41743 Transcript_14604/m.41743 type:complete len:244 (+) Transcript_14604:89-820(+)
MPKRDAKVQKLKDAYKKLDKDYSGSLDFDEMSKLLRKGNPDLTTKELQRLFKKIDTNGSGCIDFDEFVEFLFENTEFASDKPRKSATSGWDQRVDSESIDWRECDTAFQTFAGRDMKMQGLEFAKMCRDCGLFCENFKPHDCDALFSYVCKDGCRSLEKEEFLQALVQIAKKKRVPGIAVRGLVIAGKPQVNATKAQAFTFATDSPPGSDSPSDADEPRGRPRNRRPSPSPEPAASRNRRRSA